MPLAKPATPGADHLQPEVRQPLAIAIARQPEVAAVPPDHPGKMPASPGWLEAHLSFQAVTFGTCCTRFPRQSVPDRPVVRKPNVE